MNRKVEHSKGHWRCPDCGEWCRCEGTARLMPHRRCHEPQDADTDEGIRRAYESWLRAHAAPGGHS